MGHQTLLFLFFIGTTHAAQILGVFPIGGTSHYSPAESLFKALARHGHNVTVITSYPQKVPLANFHDVDVSFVKSSSINSLSFDLVKTVLQRTDANFNFLPNISRRYCEIAFSVPAVRNLLNDGSKFDAVITEIFGADCAVGFAWKFRAPLISLITSRATPWTHNRVGNPSNPSYMHTIHVNYGTKMSFFERVMNTLYWLYFSIFYEYFHNGKVTNDISRSFFGDDVPLVSDIVRNTSLVFVNSHFTLDASYPLVPNIIEIGGIHIKEPEMLPESIKKFMDDAKHGVIFFTLGSLIRVSTLPNETIQDFKNAFAELPQRILWKFELELEDIPSNVFVSKWFPQSDIMGHPNLIAFISHSGYLSTIEAVHYGVPMVTIPLYYDQIRSARSLVDKGVAVRLGLNELKKENILTAVKTIVHDKRYAHNMKELSTRFRDRPMNPADTAVYWTEYIIRHKGAHHLKTAGAKMPWYSYLLLDVVGFCAIVILMLSFASYCTLKFLIQIFRNIFNLKKLKTN